MTSVPRKTSQVRESLAAHYKASSGLHMRDEFARDPGRAGRFTVEAGPLLVDYSKNRIVDETMALLAELARASELPQRIHDLFAGAAVNASENRPALHVALRAPGPRAPAPIPAEAAAQAQSELARMYEFAGRVRSGAATGAGGRAFKTLVNLGIGGSDLGPRLCVAALSEHRTAPVSVKFVANVHGEDLFPVLEGADPATTLFVIASKSFTTAETMRNARSAREWLARHGTADPMLHFAGITANAAAAADFGIAPERLFRIWDWVGGRYSVWSAVGLPVAVAIGQARFAELLEGAHEMDMHFLTAPVESNIPAILGMLDVWYGQYFGAETHAIVPYDERLRLLPEFLGQLIMESNGKSVSAGGRMLDHASSPIIWGGVGTSAQHAFFQLLHQGTHCVPVDMLLPMQSRHDPDHHAHLVANCLAQGAALMHGQSGADAPHRDFPGNRPSTLIAYPELSPRILGMLLSMYEHATFTHAVLSGINPFDQWGVELGKQMARDILAGAPTDRHDSSTAALLARFRRTRDTGNN